MVNYPAASARVMLLHSVMGVGTTNVFPMPVERLPALRALISDNEMTHIECFPTVLRLLIQGDLLHQLVHCDPMQLRRLRSLRMHRLIDNQPIELIGDLLWEHLNLQLIHTIDFLPAASWRRTGGDFFFQIFVLLHRVLVLAGKLDAKVGYEHGWAQPLVRSARPPTWRHWLVDLAPTSMVLFMAAKQVTRFSNEKATPLRTSSLAMAQTIVYPAPADLSASPATAGSDHKAYQTSVYHGPMRCPAPPRFWVEEVGTLRSGQMGGLAACLAVVPELGLRPFRRNYVGPLRASICDANDGVGEAQ
eukprot:CAMPEP_0181231250 /NCGR_PEP_ID=MMETSP1096-20121128/34985_1 /TAXON_ID=156174 ORGANISM="Chrysochromulina ericina, Strain CCMP281" /NCGR_SAMPLE_ID=MMETSP1096 /ASSEMBLY_ACC=CAM_ASM_000453 /LENGTH=303 /DNA_ID=CAMNT_0023325237 /DNA_START=97 /DNA_END=1010 /DNA_ORIENTATION=+